MVAGKTQYYMPKNKEGFLKMCPAPPVLLIFLEIHHFKYDPHLLLVALPILYECVYRDQQNS
jgi:hypothetical protein